MSIASIQVEDHSEEVLSELKSKIPAMLEALGLAGEGNAIMEITSLGAVKTGNLKNSISHADDGTYAYIGTNVEYAPYVELGTSKMEARPFLQNAVLNHTDEYRKIFEDSLKS
jgi:HK97 gp10 family phage protein